VRNLKFKPLAAPVWLARAGASQLTGLAVTAKLRDRITRGAFAEEVIDGRHFELMSRPRVETLADHLSALLVEPGNPRSPSTVLVR
jgi:thioesterase domain-containing protein